MTPDVRAHAVAQTVAAERLEGWRPTDEHVAALAALARGEVAFADYLATFRARHPPPRRSAAGVSVFGRAAPYLIPERRCCATTSVPRPRRCWPTSNTSPLRAGWCCGCADRPSGRRPDALDVRVLHRHLFADVYPWAGEYRTTELRRGDQGFASRPTIATGMARVHDDGAGGGRRRRRVRRPPLALRAGPALRRLQPDPPVPRGQRAHGRAAAARHRRRVRPTARPLGGQPRRVVFGGERTACRFAATAGPVTGRSCRSWCVR